MVHSSLIRSLPITQEAAGWSPALPPFFIEVEDAKRQARIAADVAVKEAEEERHLPGKRPVLEAIFGRDWGSAS